MLRGNTARRAIGSAEIVHHAIVAHIRETVMLQLVDMTFRAETLSRLSLPAIPYPLPERLLDLALRQDGDLPLAFMLHGLQLRCGEGTAQWRTCEPAMARLAELLAPEEQRMVVSAESEKWFLEVGPVDLDAQLVTIQRDEQLVAAMVSRADGRLRVAAYRPLDAKSIRYLTGLGVRPHPNGTVCMRPNNFEYALDCSAQTGNLYAAIAGEAHLSNWDTGIGVERNGTESITWRPQRALHPRPVAHVVAEIGVYYSLDED
jgi:hypothetical protein